MDSVTSHHEQITIYPPGLMNSWIKNRTDASLVRDLTAYFQPMSTAIHRSPKTVCVLPPEEKWPVAFALYSVTSTYCSTLLIVLQQAFDGLHTTLFSLFEIIFSDNCSRWWRPGEFAWDRFHYKTTDQTIESQEPGDAAVIAKKTLFAPSSYE